MKAVLFFLWMLLFATFAFGDQGAILAVKEEENLQVAIFASPVPYRVGLLDVNVLLKDLISKRPLLDAEVRLSVRKLPSTTEPSWSSSSCENTKSSRSALATREHAHNKMLYGASLPIPDAGKWELTVEIVRNQITSTFTVPLDVGPAPKPLAQWWPLLTIVPLGIGVYSWRAALIRARRIRRTR